LCRYINQFITEKDTTDPCLLIKKLTYLKNEVNRLDDTLKATQYYPTTVDSDLSLKKHLQTLLKKTIDSLELDNLYNKLKNALGNTFTNEINRTSTNETYCSLIIIIAKLIDQAKPNQDEEDELDRSRTLNFDRLRTIISILNTIPRIKKKLITTKFSFQGTENYTLLKLLIIKLISNYNNNIEQLNIPGDQAKQLWENDQSIVKHLLSSLNTTEIDEILNEKMNEKSTIKNWCDYFGIQY
tara:strand:+ start:57 stop:779 length:723 start_codon:yes stop_codon:yes gene_type:complete